MSDSVPLKSLHPTTVAADNPPYPSYAEDTSSAAESQPFINPGSEDDVEAGSPPAYAENGAEEAPAKKGALDGKPVVFKVVAILVAICLGLMGFGVAITLAFAFIKFLGLIWRKLGLI
ncbi:hypothetical protein F5B19DRAFT_493052 [Rostrohypoxylon terebratum]|nr:hypothetical protein F5B19DRAFT_493052 [Rostrohypoxylon terebratum]